MNLQIKEIRHFVLVTQPNPRAGVRSGYNGSIADILEASGYSSGNEFKVDDQIGYANKIMSFGEIMHIMAHSIVTIFSSTCSVEQSTSKYYLKISYNNKFTFGAVLNCNELA